MDWMMHKTKYLNWDHVQYCSMQGHSPYILQYARSQPIYILRFILEVFIHFVFQYHAFAPLIGLWLIYHIVRMAKLIHILVLCEICQYFECNLIYQFPLNSYLDVLTYHNNAMLLPVRGVWRFCICLWCMTVLLLSVVYDGFAFVRGVWRFWICPWCMTVLHLSVVYDGFAFACGVWRFWICLWCMTVLHLSVVYDSFAFVHGVWWFCICRWCMTVLHLSVVYDGFAFVCGVWRFCICPLKLISGSHRI
jgi:hypothetical protein